FEVAERVLADGTVRTPLDDDDVRGVAARLREAGVESVAVCLLHAHLYPAHEQRLGEILREELRGIPVSLSSEILREQQEYERTATTVVNAYVRPLMARYVDELREGLGNARLTLMQSSGGGSIAWLDEAGALNVGPRSAGAAPGPACYGLGGEVPTVTDANVALGYIPEGPIADGGIEISRDRAEASLARIGAPARGVHD